MGPARLALVPLCPLLCALACARGPQAVPGTQLRLDFSRAAGLYAAPFPSDDLLRADGTVDLSLFPNPAGVKLVARALALLQGGRGFATTGGVFFSATAPLDPARLPSVAESVQSGAKVFLVAVDPDAPDYLQRVPVETAFEADGGPFGAQHQLSLVPVQGFALRPAHTYAAVVLRALGDAGGAPLGVPLALAQLLAGEPAGLAAGALASNRRALAAVRSLGIADEDVAGMAAFTTGAPAAQLTAVFEDALTRPPPALGGRPLVRTELHDDYCVYGGTVFVPDYQSGEAPFESEGGGFRFDDAGRPILQRYTEANLFVTVPRRARPGAGWPTVLYVRAGGAGEKPFVDRGPVTVAGGQPAPGLGPALHFALEGFAAAEVDGPLGGLRNPAHADEQFLIFNVLNPEALRDNVRQTALELALRARALAQLDFDTSDCPGAGARYALDPVHLALFGHSTGAWIAPLALALEPSLRLLLLSGAGGSWIENIMYKSKPVEVRPLAEALLYGGKRALSGHDPVLTLVQWAVEPSDPQVYARAALREPPPGAGPRHVLMMQGIVDHYILPRIANTTSLSLGLDLADEALDSVPEMPAGQTPLLPLLVLAGRSRLALPVSGNQDGGAVTAVVTQHLGDALQDGHEAFFQTEGPRHQARCFLASWLAGVPRVSSAAALSAPCD